VYEERCYCFSCGFTCLTTEVLDADEIKELKKAPKEKEDAQETIRYIETLPKKRIRGLSLHSETSGFFIVWPDRSFYKKRLQREDGGSRYIGPRGHKPPLFKYESQNRYCCVVVEGELNCMSLCLGLDGVDISIVSPGSANSLMDHTEYYLQFRLLVIVVDKDKTGVENGSELKQYLLSHKKRVILIGVDKDFNQTLQESGPEGVKQQFMKELGI
jgi:hypothetical protein